jgi:hypothetical protein
MTTTESADGYMGGWIRNRFDDEGDERCLNLGGIGWGTKAEVERYRGVVPTFSGVSSFVAERLDPNGELQDSKRVSAEFIEEILGEPIDMLIQSARDSASNE